ncbi:MAG TPA: bifunctional NUDIX hydrolase/histidine phosphatase family protein [Mycobacterium sp.]
MPKTSPPAGEVPADRIINAAGGVLWRPHRKEIEVAVVHRPRYDDWSLPKGKVDAGETEPVTAAREIFEETGHCVHLGRQVGTVSYPVQQGIKKVHYWAARSIGGKFVANHEVDDLTWLSIAEAMKALEYPYDRKILRRFAKHPADTQTVLIVRHGAAGRKSRYSGDDTKRPLDKKGRAQAESLTAQLLAFGANDVYAADRLRCHQTVEPLARHLGVVIGNEPALTEEAYAQNPKQARRRVLEIAGVNRSRRRSGLSDGDPTHIPVICSQGKVIPGLIAWWCERDGVRPDKSRNRKGSTWVLSLSGGRLVAADHMGSALAGKSQA